MMSFIGKLLHAPLSSSVPDVPMVSLLLYYPAPLTGEAFSGLDWMKLPCRFGALREMTCEAEGGPLYTRCGCRGLSVR